MLLAQCHSMAWRHKQQWLFADAPLLHWLAARARRALQVATIPPDRVVVLKVARLFLCVCDVLLALAEMLTGCLCDLWRCDVATTGVKCDVVSVADMCISLICLCVSKLTVCLSVDINMCIAD
jgi:hypothetical protein